MFGLVLPRAHRVRPVRRKLLRLESLEGREQPDGGVGDPPPPLESPPPLTLTPPANPATPANSTLPANVAPIIMDFSAVETGNGDYLITGRVVDETPSGMIVTLAGSTSASGSKITVSSDGTFSAYVHLHTDGTDAGYIATTTDALGLKSGQVQVLVDP